MGLSRLLAAVLVLAPLPVRAQSGGSSNNNNQNNSLDQTLLDSSDQSTHETSDPSSEQTQNWLYGTTGNGPGNATQQQKDQEQTGRLIAAGLAVVVIGLVVLAVSASHRPGQEAPAPGPHDAQLRAWLEGQQMQLRVDLGRGRGPTLEDLAAVYRIPPQDRAPFGQALRGRREELLALADPGRLDVGRGRAFLRRIGEILEADPVLLPDYQRWRMAVFPDLR